MIVFYISFLTRHYLQLPKGEIAQRALPKEIAQRALPKEIAQRALPKRRLPIGNINTYFSSFEIIVTTIVFRTIIKIHRCAWIDCGCF